MVAAALAVMLLGIGFSAGGATSAAAPSNASSLPTVSVVMPTNSRPEYVRRAVAMLSRQDYPHSLIKELIIVDDSAAELQATDVMNVTWPRVVYTTLQERRSIGRKRNIAALRAVGEVIAHWDDDDIYGPSRLREQVEPLARGFADVTLMEHRWTYFVSADELYHSSTGGAAGWGPHFGTLVYRRELFTRGVRYPDHSEAEDYGWAQRAVEAGARLSVVPTAAAADGEPTFVCVRHGSNTWEWSERKEGALRTGATGELAPSSLLSAADRAFAARARASGLLEQLASRRANKPPLRRYPSPEVDPNFFNALYGVAAVPRAAPQQRGAVAAAAAAAAAELLAAQAPAARLDAITYFDWQDPTCALVNKSFSIKYRYACVNNRTVQGLAAKQNKSAAAFCIGALNCAQAQYDLSGGAQPISALPAPPAGSKVGFLGGAKLPSGAYGGRFVAAASLKLAASVQLVYYTELKVAGDLDCAGFDLLLGAWANLTVTGKLVNCGTVTVGSFARLNVAGDAAVKTLDALAGGVCVSELCDTGFFSLAWHEMADSSCLMFPALECGCYLKGFQDFGHAHHNCYYSRIAVGGSFALGGDAELMHYMSWQVGGHTSVGGSLLVYKFRPELRVGGNLSVAGGVNINDFPIAVSVGQHMSASSGLSLSVAPNGTSWRVLSVGQTLKIDGDVASLYGNLQINGTVESTYTLSIRLPNRLDLIEECLFTSDVKVSKGAVAVSADEEAGVGLNFCGSLSVQGAGQLGGDSAAWHKTTIKGDLTIQDELTLFDTHMVEVHGAVKLGSNLHVEQSASVNAHLLLQVEGDVYAQGGAVLSLGDFSANGVSLQPGAQLASGGINATAISAGVDRLCGARPRPGGWPKRAACEGGVAGTALIEAAGDVDVGEGGVDLQGFSRLFVTGDLHTTSATLQGGVVRVRNGSLVVAKGLTLAGDNSLDLSGALSAASLSADGLSLSAASVVLGGGSGELSLSRYTIAVLGPVAVGAATLQSGLLKAGSFTAAATKCSGTVETTGDFDVLSLSPREPYVPGYVGNQSYLDLRTGNLRVRGAASLVQGMAVHAAGTQVNFSSLQMSHRSELTAPNAKVVTIGQQLALGPHVGTQCAGQKDVRHAGNGLGNPNVTKPTCAPNCPKVTDPAQPMLCPWSESFDEPDDCTFQHAVGPSGLSPASNVSYNASWLYKYAAINEWCFADQRGSLLFPLAQPCPGGSLAACYGWCPRSNYFDDDRNTTCVASCKRLCGELATGRSDGARLVEAAHDRRVLPAAVA